MPAIKDCIPAIIKASGDTLTEREAGDLLRQYTEKTKLAELGKEVNAEMLKKDADDIARAKLFNALREQRQKVINMGIRKNILTSIRTNFKGNTLEGLIARVGGSNTDAATGRISADTAVRSRVGELFGALENRLHNDGVLELFATDKFEPEVAKALSILETKGGDLSKLEVPLEAKKIAQAIYDVTTPAVERVNRAGASIGKLEGFFMRQVHNPNEMRRAAWDFRLLSPSTWSEWRRPTKEANQAAWVNEIKGRLDLEKSFPGKTDAEITDALKEDWSQFIMGDHIASHGEEDYQGFTGYRNLAKSLSGKRTYHFKSVEDALAYDKKFGSGGLKYAVTARLEQLGRNIGLMESLGPNPNSMVKEVLGQLKQDAKDAGELEQFEKLKQGEDFLDNMMRQVDGSVNIPVNPSLAKWGSYIRNWTTLSRMGFVTPHSFGDFATITTRLKLQGIDLSTSYPSLLGNAFQNVSGDRRKIASLFGFAQRSFVGDLNKTWLKDGPGPGFTSKFMETYFRLNLLNRFDHANNSTVAWLLSHDLAEHSSYAFDKLKEVNPELGKTLEQYGVTPKDWDLYREFGKWKADTGHEVMTPDQIKNIPEDRIKEALTADGRAVTPANIKRYYDELSSKFSSYVVDSADFAVPRPGARVNALLIGSSKRGEWSGEVRRFWAQFKPFQVSIYQKGLVPTLRSKNIPAMANYLAGTVALGYVGYAISDYLSGKKPKDFTDPKVVWDSMLKGGGLGPYGDYLFGNFEAHKHPFLGTFLGPTIGQVNDVFDIFTKAKQAAAGDEKADPFAALVKFGQRNTPGQNLWFMKHALDRAIFWKMQETFNPGSLRRMENASAKNEQEYQDNVIFKPPTSAE